MFNVSLWPHIRTRFDWKQLGFREFLTLLPLAAFGFYLWGWGFGRLFLASLLVGSVWHLYACKKAHHQWSDLWFLNDVLLISLLMPAGTVPLVPAGLTLACGVLRTYARDKEFTFPVNIPLALALLAILGGRMFGTDINFDVIGMNGAVLRGQAYFISGWLPVGSTVLFSFLFLNRLYKWRILLSGVLMPLAFLYLQYRAGGVLDHQLSWLSAVYIFALGVLATDHSSTPARHWGQFWFGMLCGILIFMFSLKGLYLEGILFSPVIAGLATPLLDKLAGMSGRAAATFNLPGKP